MEQFQGELHYFLSETKQFPRQFLRIAAMKVKMNQNEEKFWVE